MNNIKISIEDFDAAYKIAMDCLVNINARRFDANTNDFKIMIDGNEESLKLIRRILFLSGATGGFFK